MGEAETMGGESVTVEIMAGFSGSFSYYYSNSAPSPHPV